MRPITSSLVAFIGSGFLATCVTLFVGWPSAVDAEGVEQQATLTERAKATAVGAPENQALAVGQSRIDDLDVTATLEPSVTKGVSVIRLECQNGTDKRIAGNVQIELGRSDSIPIGRVETPVVRVWQHRAKVDVPPHETVVRLVSIPTKVSKELVRLEKAREHAESNSNVVYPNTFYSASAYPVVPVSIEPTRETRPQVEGDGRVVALSKGKSNQGRSVPTML